MLKDTTAKLVDFGLAAPIISTDTSPQGRAFEQLGLTRAYAAPERFVQLPGSDCRQDPIGVKSDVYSFGLLLYFLWTCQVNFCNHRLEFDESSRRHWIWQTELMHECLDFADKTLALTSCLATGSD